MLKLENVSVTFEKGTVNEKKALSSLSLHLKPGDFVTVLGSNGAGKSTLLGVIAGTVIPEAGRVVLAGQDITRLPDYKRSRAIGRLFQDPQRGTAPNMTVGENLALAYLRASAQKRPLSRISRQERALFRERLGCLGLGLEDRMDQPVGLLSGGQRQALTLLMATLVSPQLLLLDEHTAALDPATAETVLTLTKQAVKETGTTCLMITHNLRDALRMGNRTVLMENGCIVLDLEGDARAGLTTDGLLHLFRTKGLDNDRILLSGGGA